MQGAIVNRSRFIMITAAAIATAVFLLHVKRGIPSKVDY